MYVGIDLAWSARNRTGLAVADESGALVASASARSDDEIAAWLATHAPRPAVVAIDAPIVVANATGMREAEKQMQRHFGPFHAGAYPSNRANRLFDPPRAGELARVHGWDTDPRKPGSTDHPVALETFPHPAMVVLFGLPRVLPYKRGRGRTTEERRLVFARLLDLMETLEPLRLGENDRWREIRAAVAGATRPVELNRVEDEIDGVLCAHLAWLWHHRPGFLQVYGDPGEGTIVAPAPPGSRDGAGAPPRPPG